MTPLAARLARRIAATGPVSLADYMAECLLDPDHGYYATRDPLGAAGDFVTAPEISQMFGEVVGLAMAQAWINQGRLAPVTLAELGPGRGTLMADLLRAAGRVPGFAQAVQVHLVEASPALRARQAATLRDAAPVWHESVQSLPQAPLLVVANEFLDALPIRQFVREADLWRERQVGVRDGVLRLGLAAPAPYPALDHRLADTTDGDLVELCPAAAAILDALADRIARHGGAALVIDYGAGPSLGDTFQAVRGHEPVDPLATPGEADLTAHVDFAALAEGLARRGDLRIDGPVAQGILLERLGITARAQALARSCGPGEGAAIAAAHRRLTHPAEMGSLFKCLAFSPAGGPGFPGAHS